MANEEIHFNYDKKLQVTTVTLQREASLNALTFSMIKSLREYLARALYEDKVQAIFIQGNGRAFCAGGDIRYLYEQGKKNIEQTLELFKYEYQLNYLIRNYHKPYIPWLHAITMGGGAGLSIHAKHCVATENLVFAMPETAIGFFPDVGASYFLSRLPGYLGMYLGLTGEKINAYDALYAGLVSYVIPAKLLTDCKAHVAKDLLNLEQILASYAMPLEHSFLEQQRHNIDNCFCYNSVAEIISALEINGSKWALSTLETILKRSPTSIKVTHQMLMQAKQLSFAECLQMEYVLVSNFLQSDDLYTGIYKTIIDKSYQAEWSPNHVDLVSDELAQSFFQGDAKLNFLDVE